MATSSGPGPRLFFARLGRQQRSRGHRIRRARRRLGRRRELTKGREREGRKDENRAGDFQRGRNRCDSIRLLGGDSANMARGRKPITANYRVKLFGECFDYGAIFGRLTSD